MITEEQAASFAEGWLKAWNDHDIHAIMEHYAEDIQFHSPFIALLKFNETGIIEGRGRLKEYFQVGLNAYPDLDFTLHKVLSGIDSIVLYYTSVNGRIAAEMFELNERGQAQRVLCHYTS